MFNPKSIFYGVTEKEREIVRVLVTGSAGKIGRWLIKSLVEAGHEVRTFDRTARHRGEDWEHIPGDLRDIAVVRQAVQDMDAVAHMGAISFDSRTNSPEELLEVNVQGTWNMLLACVEAGVERLVYFSSINALGCVGGHRPAAYLPIDDVYPHHPLSPYQLSKHLGEELCKAFTDKHGLITPCLRPVYVTAPDQYEAWQKPRTERQVEWAKSEYWAYVDVRDVCAATLLSLTTDQVKHDAFLLTADDTNLTIPTTEAVDRFHPETPWKQERAAYLADQPYRSLMDCTHAKEVLGWQPKHSWRDHVE